MFHTVTVWLAPPRGIDKDSLLLSICFVNEHTNAAGVFPLPCLQNVPARDTETWPSGLQKLTAEDYCGEAIQADSHNFCGTCLLKEKHPQKIDRTQLVAPFLVSEEHKVSVWEGAWRERAGDDIVVDFLWKGLIWFLLMFLPLKSLKIKTAQFSGSQNQ